MQARKRGFTDCSVAPVTDVSRGFWTDAAAAAGAACAQDSPPHLNASSCWDGVWCARHAPPCAQAAHAIAAMSNVLPLKCTLRPLPTCTQVPKLRCGAGAAQPCRCNRLFTAGAGATASRGAACARQRSFAAGRQRIECWPPLSAAVLSSSSSSMRSRRDGPVKGGIHLYTGYTTCHDRLQSCGT